MMFEDTPRTFQRVRSASLAALFGLLCGLAPTAAVADCVVVEDPAPCELTSSVGDGFWIGQYAVEPGMVHVTTGGMTMAHPAEPLPPVTISQWGDKLLLDHPTERSLQATLVDVGPGAPAWSWDPALAQGLPGVTLSDVDDALQCTNADLPRWRAEVTSEAGFPMQIDLVAVGSQTILALLHGQGVVEGRRVTLRRRIIFRRDGYPIEGLPREVRSTAKCDQICSGSAHRCPGRPD